MDEAMDNREALRQAGIIADQPLPDAYYELIDSLEPHEIEVLVSLRKRLIDAGVPTRPLTAPEPGSAVCVVPF